mmetsp:Transcript_46212/g.147690  ORF Transcript_46212/g.147690 Transcript_46212/m.147690 type:complete len:539 (+) Transcript_46212:116-1732(+)
MAKNVQDILLTDIDFEKVKDCSDKRVLKRYIHLLEEDGAYFVDLLNATKQKLLEVAPKDYYHLYPRVATDAEVIDTLQDMLEWEAVVKETDAALLKSRKNQIWDDGPSVSKLPIRGQEPVVSRPNIQDSKERSRPASEQQKARDEYARDKSKMKDYYRAWDKFDVDGVEEEIDQKDREEEDAKRKHFDDLKEKQDEAHRMTPVQMGNVPANIPEAHRKHMADSEKEKGNEAFYSKDFEEADAYYSRSLHFRGDDPSTWANRALVRLRLERPEAALADCDKALEQNPRYMKALHRKGKALHELKRFEEAVKCFQLALAESPGNTQINGDLLVSRRHLRSDPEPPQHRVNDPSSCRFEEIEDDDEAAAPGTAPPSGYTRVLIEDDDSDSEEEAVPVKAQTKAPAPVPAPAGGGGASASASRGFHKVVIEDVSGSEDEDEAPKPVAAPKDFIAAKTFAGAKTGMCFQTGPQGLGYYLDGAAPAPRPAAKPAAPAPTSTAAAAAPQQTFAPPPREAAAPAPAPPAAAPLAEVTSAVSFDDMD